MQYLKTCPYVEPPASEPWATASFNPEMQRTRGRTHGVSKPLPDSNAPPYRAPAFSTFLDLIAVFIDHRCIGANSTLCAYLEPDGSSELAFFQCNNGVCDTEAIES